MVSFRGGFFLAAFYLFFPNLDFSTTTTDRAPFRLSVPKKTPNTSSPINQWKRGIAHFTDFCDKYEKVLA
jgi:hypothetical protein